ncbi:MAG: hypothetical protein OEY03_04030 [Rhizobacter sp.]|nr:hypothetical protein [Rhizobacter sp.]
MTSIPQIVVAIAITLGLAHVPASAQSTAPAKSTAKKAAKAPAKSKSKAPEEKPLPTADKTQMDAAERTFFGAYECELDQAIDVGMSTKAPGYVDVNFKKKTYTMKPIVSSTGALRLEDVKGVMLLIQIANKSMMMDTKAGQRVVDGCVHEKQRAAAKLATDKA